MIDLPVSSTQDSEETALSSVPNRDFNPAYTAAILKQVQVLVIEDHEDSREFVQQILEEAGASVIAASCAQDAITLLEHSHPDVIVSDIAMPGEDGYQLMRHIRASGVKEIPAIALTAYVRPEDRREALKAGFQTHLAKPIDAQELVSVIDQLVNHFAALDRPLLNT